MANANAIPSVHLPESILRAAETQSRLERITPEVWLECMAASHLDTDEGAREFFRRRAAGAKPGALEAWLDSRPNLPPMPGDELE